MSSQNPHHRIGHDVDTIDQTSSVHMISLAIIGALSVVLLEWLVR